MKHITILIFALLAVVLVACNPEDTTEPLTQELPPANDPAVSAPSEPMFNGQVVTDSRTNITFNYPDGWHIIEPNVPDSALSYVYTMQSFEPFNSRGEGIPADASKVDLLITPDSQWDSIDSIRDRLSQDEANNTLTIQSEERITLATGHPALVIEGEGFQGGTFTSIYTVINGHEISANGIGNKQFALDVAKSLRSK